MPKSIRRFLIVLYTLFFIAFSVFLLINSFGYRLNTRERRIENSANITLRTAPFGAAITIQGDNQTYITPAELTFSQPGQVNLNLTKEGYSEERFTITYTGGSNSSTVIDRLYLLPLQPANTFTYQNALIRSYLNDTSLLIQRQNVLTVETIGFVGIASSLPVINENGAIIGNDMLNFTHVGPDVYWDPTAQLLLLKRTNSWSLYTLGTLSQRFHQVVANDGILIGLDTEKKVWSWNYSNGVDAQFIDSNVSGITFTSSPRTYWLLKNNWIQTITLDGSITAQITPRNARVTNNALLTEKPQTFEILTVYQGYAIRINERVWYRPDFSATNLTFVTPNARLLTTVGDSIYWVNTDNVLLFSNLRSLNRSSISTDIPTDITTLSYHSAWSRIMLLSPSRTYSIWHDNDKINSDIKNYAIIPWLESACSPILDTDIVLCGNNREASLYTNRSLLL